MVGRMEKDYIRRVIHIVPQCVLAATPADRRRIEVIQDMGRLKPPHAA